MLTRLFYIRVSPDRIRVDSPGVRPGYDDAAVLAVDGPKIAAFGKAAEALKGKANVTLHRPFSHPRMVVGDFTLAQKLLQNAVRAFVQKQPWHFVRPAVKGIIHPLREVEGGLSQIEERALTELLASCGARISAVHVGRELTDAEVEAYAFTRI